MIGGQHLPVLIEHQQAGPGAVEVVGGAVEDQLRVLVGMLGEDQAVLQALAHHAHQAQGLAGGQVAVAGHIEHPDQLPLGVEQRRGGAGHVAVLAQEVFVLANVNRLGADQRGAQRIGADTALVPVGTGAEAMLLARLDEPPRAPAVEQAAAGIGQHHQVAGIAQQVRILRQHRFAGQAQQGLALLQQGVQLGAGQAVEVRGVLGLQAVVAAAGPGGLDQLGMGRSGCGHGPVLCDCCHGADRCSVSCTVVQCQTGKCSVVQCLCSLVNLRLAGVASKAPGQTVAAQLARNWLCPADKNHKKATPCPWCWNRSAAASTTRPGSSMPHCVSNPARSTCCWAAPWPARPA
ncbi:hypothetical protein D3C72_1049020 [compost metagenome]